MSLPSQHINVQLYVALKTFLWYTYTTHIVIWTNWCINRIALTFNGKLNIYREICEHKFYYCYGYGIVFCCLGCLLLLFLLKNIIREMHGIGNVKTQYLVHTSIECIQWRGVTRECRNNVSIAVWSLEFHKLELHFTILGDKFPYCHGSYWSS